MVFWHAITAAALLTGAVDVRVTTLRQETVTGQLIDCADDRLSIDIGGETKRLAVRDVLSVTPAKPPRMRRGRINVWLRLNDGTRLHGVDYAVTKTKGVLTLLDGSKVELRSRRIHSIRFRAQSEYLANQWQQIIDRGLRGDVMVVRRDQTAAGAAEQVALDHVEGVLLGMDDGNIRFEFDGNQLSVKLDKVEGIIYSPQRSRSSDQAVCRIKDDCRNIWLVSRMSTSSDRLSITTVSGVRHDLPLSAITDFDFSIGKVHYLSDLTVADSTWLPYLQTGIVTKQAEKLFGFRSDRALTGGPLTVGGETYAKGLAIHSQGTLVYRVPTGFKRFQAIAGIDDAVRPRGNVKLVLQGDRRVLFESVLSGQSEPLSLDVDISGVRRLTILVDYGDGLDIADHLDLCNARITK